MLLKSELLQGTSKTQYLGKLCAQWGIPVFQKELQNYLLSKPQKNHQAYQTTRDVYNDSAHTWQQQDSSNHRADQLTNGFAFRSWKWLPFLLLSWSFPIHTHPVPLSTLNWAQKESWKISKHCVARNNFLPVSVGSSSLHKYLLPVHLLSSFPK